MRTILCFLLCAVMMFSCSSKVDHGKAVTLKGHTLYYLDPVTETEARDVLNWLHEIMHNFGEPPVPFQLSKNGDRYIFKYPVQVEGAITAEGNMTYIQNFANHLSERLGKKPVDIVLTSEDLTATKKVIRAQTAGN